MKLEALCIRLIYSLGGSGCASIELRVRIVSDVITLILRRVKILFTSPKGIIDQMKIERIIVIFSIAACFGCQLFKDKDVPKELLGVWETSVPRYENCSFQFEDTMVTFQNRLSHIVSCYITDIERLIEDEKTLYNIYYNDEHGGEYKFSLYYLKAPHGGVIRFKHQEGIPWLKRDVQQNE
jgi:hypothetical protein